LIEIDLKRIILFVESFVLTNAGGGIKKNSVNLRNFESFLFHRLTKKYNSPFSYRKFNSIVLKNN